MLILIMLCTLLTMIGLSSAQAEEPTVITLSCDGTTKAYVSDIDTVVVDSLKRLTLTGQLEKRTSCGRETLNQFIEEAIYVCFRSSTCRPMTCSG
jgi:hypothetical protein